MAKQGDPGITIRKATNADQPLLSEMGARMFADTFSADNTHEDMTAYLASSFNATKQNEELTSPSSVFYIAEINHNLVGYVRLVDGSEVDCVKAVHPMELVRIYSAKEWIGHGIGAALMNQAVKHAAELGCDVIWLDVWEKNTRAIRFYQKWGYVIVGDQSFQLGSDSQHDFIMSRPVA
jgi:diamine N-acetyltransferase